MPIRVMIYGMSPILIDTETMDKITERYINEASKGDMEGYVKALSIHSKRRVVSLPWYFYLKKLMGKVASGHKKTTMRRNRRQPERLELSGTLRQHKAKRVGRPRYER